MWKEILNGIIKGGSSTPKPISVDSGKSDNVALYIVAVVVLVVLAFVIVKISSK